MVIAGTNLVQSVDLTAKPMPKQKTTTKNPYAIYNTIDRWIFRVWIYGILFLQWFFLSDLPTINGHGYWYYFWPVVVIVTGVAVAVEYNTAKGKL